MIDKIKHLKLKKEQAITIGLVFAILLTTIIINIYLPNNQSKLKADIISLKENEAMFSSDFNAKIRKLAGTYNGNSYDISIIQIKKSTTISNSYKTSNNIISTAESSKPIYAWYSNGIIYWYTEANKVYLNPNSSYMFSNLTKLETIPELSQFDTSKVTNMSRMFAECHSLTSLNLSNFNTSKVTSMENMFYFCKKLINLNLSSFNTSKVTNMSMMFAHCYDLSSLNLSSFDTSKVTDMSAMFLNCNNITSLNVSKFNTSNVTDMGAMFNGCSSLTSLNLSNFKTSKVTNMSWMFVNCERLTTLNLSSFDTSNVTSMSLMFRECSSLTSLNLSNFKTSKVTDMSDMFYFCENLTSLNLSNFNTSKVTDMRMMFRSCYKLKKIIVSNKFSITSLPANYPYNLDSMFEDCYNLVGGNGTKYNENYIDKTYARIDKAGAPGYFTSANTRMAIDSPKNNPQITSSNVVISGWAMSHIYDKRVDIYVDNTKISGVTRVKRDDVIKAITDAGSTIENPNPGFTVTHSIAGLSNGTHTVKVNVVDTQNNTILQTGTATFTLQRKSITVSFNKNAGTTSNPVTQTFTTQNNNRFGYNTDGTPRWEQTGQFGSWDRSGYTLLGWSTNKNATSATYTPYNNVTDSWINTNSPSITLYAVWQPMKITTIYHKNDGINDTTASQTFSGGINNQKFGYNTDGKCVWECTGQFGQWDRTGYVLLGWSMDSKATSASWGVYSDVIDSWIIDVYNNKTGQTPNQTINLYAVWSPKKITVEFNKNFGTSDPVEQEFTYGAKNNKFGYNTDGTSRWEQIGQFGKWDREGYTLLGWSTDSNATKETYSVYSNVTNNWINTMYDKPNHKISLYAVWLKDGIDLSKLTIKEGKVILTKNSTKKTITDIIGTTGVKVLSNNVEITDNITILKTGDILNVNNTNYPIVILGDVDLNGEINVTDIVGIRKRIKQGPSTFTEIQLMAADYNQDEYINVTDIVGLRKLIKGN